MPPISVDRVLTEDTVLNKVCPRFCPRQGQCQAELLISRYSPPSCTGPGMLSSEWGARAALQIISAVVGG